MLSSCIAYRSDNHLNYRFLLKIVVMGTLSCLACSRERLSVGVDDTEALWSISIALSEALDDREFGAETRVSGRGIRLSLGPLETGVCGPFDVDGAADAASTKGALGVTTGPLRVVEVGSWGLCGAAPACATSA